jgi:hypothetical protein
MNNTKYCVKCKDTKPLFEYYKDKGRKDGVTVYCIPCHAIAKKECIARNPQMQSNVHKKRRWNRKIELFKVLEQSCCTYCEFAIYPALQFEHKNGNGAQDKIRFKNLDQFYKHYINNPEEARRELQITCANCNWIKRYQNDEQIKKEIILN